MSSRFNIWDQAGLTILVQAAVDRVLGDGRERVATQFAPIVGTRSDKINRQRIKVRAVGKGSFVADDATPPIYRARTKITEEAFELLRIAEMAPIEESLRRRLENNGTDPDSVERRARAGVDITTIGRALQVRNENQSDWMTMYAIVNGSLPIDVVNPPDGDTETQYALDYEYPAGHIFSVGTTWSNLTGSTPVTDMRTIQERTKAASGSYAIHFWMGSQAWQYVLRSKEVRDTLTPGVGPQYIATEQHVKNLMYEPNRVVFHVGDEGWFEESAGYDTELDANKTRWIPVDRVLATTEDPHKGERIMEMFDGMVPVQTSWNDYDYRGPGPQSFTQLIQGNLTLVLRQESRRVPVINKPECIVSAKVVL